MRVSWPVLAAIAALLIALAVLVALQVRRRKGVYVIGRELAEASSAEERRKQQGDIAPSPMPVGTYDSWTGEQSLINPVKNALDSELSDFCRRFAEGDVESRSAIRIAISMDEFYTLLTFSQRASVFAIREENPEWIVIGLSAIAMIEKERTDYRDILVALSLLYHSATRIGENPDQLLRSAAVLSEAGVSELIVGFVERPQQEKDLRSSWGYDEVQTSGGTGFIGWGFEHYNPSCDLKQVVLEIAELIAADKYQPGSVQVATSLPATWLESKQNRSLDNLLSRVRAGASIHARLRPTEHPSFESQTLMLFLIEVEDKTVADELLQMSRRKNVSDYGMIGIAEGSLYCLLVGRSFVGGVQSFETNDSLSRFLLPIARILKQHAGRA